MTIFLIWQREREKQKPAACTAEVCEGLHTIAVVQMHEKEAVEIATSKLNLHLIIFHVLHIHM